MLLFYDKNINCKLAVGPHYTIFLSLNNNLPQREPCEGFNNTLVDLDHYPFTEMRLPLTERPNLSHNTLPLCESSSLSPRGNTSQRDAMPLTDRKILSWSDWSFIRVREPLTEKRGLSQRAWPFIESLGFSQGGRVSHRAALPLSFVQKVIMYNKNTHVYKKKRFY